MKASNNSQYSFMFVVRRGKTYAHVGVLCSPMPSRLNPNCLCLLNFFIFYLTDKLLFFGLLKFAEILNKVYFATILADKNVLESYRPTRGL